MHGIPDGNYVVTAGGPRFALVWGQRIDTTPRTPCAPGQACVQHRETFMLQPTGTLLTW